MSLFDQVNDDIKKAMMAKEKEKLEALRMIKAALLIAKTEKNASDELSDDIAIKVMQKLVKQRKDTAEIYTGQNRQDLADKELFEVTVAEKYLPKQMSTEEITAIIKGVVEKVGAKGPSDMGKVMGAATKELAGKADGKLVADAVKAVLAAL